MESDERIGEMQAYLKREIAEQSYDAEVFTEFISQKKDCGEDLENWTLEEVQQVVAEFKQQRTETPSSKPPESSSESSTVACVFTSPKETRTAKSRQCLRRKD